MPRFHLGIWFGGSTALGFTSRDIFILSLTFFYRILNLFLSFLEPFFIRSSFTAPIIGE